MVIPACFYLGSLLYSVIPDSFYRESILVYFQADPGKPTVTCGTVSWVKAGWAGINMVQSKHIHRGLVRVAEYRTLLLSDLQKAVEGFDLTEIEYKNLESLSGDFFDETLEMEERVTRGINLN